MLITENIKEYLPELILALKQTGIMLLFSVVSMILLGLPMGTYFYFTRIRPNKNPVIRMLSLVLDRLWDTVRSYPFLLFVIAIIPFTRYILKTSFGTYAACVPLVIISACLFTRQVEIVLLEVPEQIIKLSEALGATTFQFIFKFLYVEARSALVLAFTSVLISMLSYSTVMGIVGGGGIGDFAIRYGYQSYKYDIMHFAIIIMIIFVSLVQILGNKLARKLDKKKAGIL